MRRLGANLSRSSFPAALALGRGPAGTTLHLMHQAEAAELLGIPYEKVTQVALVPLAWSVGTDFKPARRKPMEDLVHLNSW